MPIIEWDNKYSVGNEEIDAHHKHLVQLLNKAYDHSVHPGTVEEFDQALKEIADYAAYHFACEEQWMSNTSYPGLEEHKEEHKLFAGKISDIQASRSGADGSSQPDLLLLLINWFTRHILVTDHNYRHYLSDNANGFSIYLMKRTVF